MSCCFVCGWWWFGRRGGGDEEGGGPGAAPARGRPRGTGGVDQKKKGTWTEKGRKRTIMKAKGVHLKTKLRARGGVTSAHRHRPKAPFSSRRRQTSSCSRAASSAPGPLPPPRSRPLHGPRSRRPCPSRARQTLRLLEVAVAKRAHRRLLVLRDARRVALARVGAKRGADLAAQGLLIALALAEVARHDEQVLVKLAHGHLLEDAVECGARGGRGGARGH